jgi:hypothetical protein
MWLPVFLKNKAISIHRLRSIIFGKGYNKKNLEPLSDEISSEETNTSPLAENKVESNQDVKESPNNGSSGEVASITSNQQEKAKLKASSDIVKKIYFEVGVAKKTIF